MCRLETSTCMYAAVDIFSGVNNYFSWLGLFNLVFTYCMIANVFNFKYVLIKLAKSSYEDIDEIQSNASTRYDQIAHRVAPKPPQRTAPTITAPLQVPALSPNQEIISLPHDPHTYLELLHEDEQRNAPIGGPSINLPMNVGN